MRGDENGARTLKVCFVVPYAYSLFNTETGFPFGGSEVRAWLLGTGLADDRDLDISFVVYNHKQPEYEQFGNVDIWRGDMNSPNQLYIPRNYWRAIKGMTRRILSAPARRFRPPAVFIPPDYRIYHQEYEAYKKASADVYCVFGVHSLAAQVVGFCKLHGKKSVIFSASDEDFCDLYYPGSVEVNAYGNVGYLADFAIKNADTIICQTQQQANLCLEGFGRGAFVVGNPVDFSGGKVEFDFSERGNYALWVGKSDRTKQPDLMLKLAAYCPDIPFVMVMNRSISGLHDRVIKKQLPNTEIIEYVPFSEIRFLYANAKVLVNTSKFEGFPNTFLEAGKCGVPLVSLAVDPDRFIERYNCGISARGNLKLLEEGLRDLFATPERWETCARNVANYVRTNHNSDDKVAAVREILLSGAMSERLPVINI